MCSKANDSDWVLLSVCLPGQQARPAGILLLDRESNRLHIKTLDTLLENEGGEFSELWRAFCEDLHHKAAEMLGEQMLEWLESSVSNFIRINEREKIAVSDFDEALSSLFKAHVSSDSGYFAVSSATG